MNIWKVKLPRLSHQRFLRRFRGTILPPAWSILRRLPWSDPFRAGLWSCRLRRSHCYMKSCNLSQNLSGISWLRLCSRGTVAPPAFNQTFPDKGAMLGTGMNIHWWRIPSDYIREPLILRSSPQVQEERRRRSLWRRPLQPRDDGERGKCPDLRKAECGSVLTGASSGWTDIRDTMIRAYLPNVNFRLAFILSFTGFCDTLNHNPRERDFRHVNCLHAMSVFA